MSCLLPEQAGTPRWVIYFSLFDGRPRLTPREQFADTRAAHDDLDASTKDRIKDHVLWHSQQHSRRKANPGEPILDQEKVCPLHFRRITS